MPTTSRLTLRPHPRLYLATPLLERRSEGIPLASELLQRAATQVACDARRYARMPPVGYETWSHNALLLRARVVNLRVTTLLVQWQRTGERRFRRAVLDYVALMGQWEYWSWIAWCENDPRDDATFDLSYGENCATLALAYDLLHEGLTPEKRRLFLGVARRPFRAATRWMKPGASSWFGRPDSNWNTVCAGGFGMLALAMYDDVATARRLFPRVEESIAPFFKTLERTGGGWPEGIGYWNYGMRYGFMYLLSRERATGRQHPVLQRRSTRSTLSFPLDFCPHGQPCSFGDVNRWSPDALHVAAASRMRALPVLSRLQAAFARKSALSSLRPMAAELLALWPERDLPATPASTGPCIRLYRGLDWGLLADRMPEPNLYMAVRGGTTDVPHGHLDLLSFHCVVGGEQLVVNVSPREYLDTTFSARRNELLEIGPHSKNTILINGVGITANATLDSTKRIRVGDVPGIRMVATSAMGRSRNNRPAATFCGRIFLLLPEGAFLIVDRVELPFSGRVETRLHTRANVRMLRTGAVLHGTRERLRVAWACNRDARLRQGTVPLTTPTDPNVTLLRWGTTTRLERTVTMATLLLPGSGKAGLTLEDRDGRLRVHAQGRTWERELCLTHHLGAPRR